jgi:NitT/TauT family transport system substrate-binding protein
VKIRSILSNSGLSLAGIFLLVGCQQSAVVKPEAKPSTSASPAALVMPAATESGLVRLGFNNWPGYMPWQVGDKAKLFKSNKGTLVPVWYDEYLKGIGALVAGQLDANSQTLMDTILSVANGSDEVVVLVNDNSVGNDKIIAKSGINSIKDLKGKTISTEKGTVDHYLLLLALKKNGLTEQDVTIKFSGGIQESAEEFAAGKVDAAAVYAPFTNIALKRAGSKELVSSKDFPGAISDVLSFRRSFVEKNPELVQAVVDNWFDSLAYIKANPAKANEMMANRSKVTVAEYVEFGKGIKIFDNADNLKAFTPGKDYSSVMFSADELKKTVVDLGLTTKTANVSKLFDDRFVKAYAAKQK